MQANKGCGAATSASITLPAGKYLVFAMASASNSKGNQYAWIYYPNTSTCVRQGYEIQTWYSVIEPTSTVTLSASTYTDQGTSAVVIAWKIG